MESAVAVQMKGWACALSNRLLGDHVEPDLNLVKPGGVGQHQMDMKARMQGQPAHQKRFIVYL